MTASRHREIIAHFSDRAIDLKRRYPSLLGALTEREQARLDRLMGARDVPGGLQLSLDQVQREKEIR